MSTIVTGIDIGTQAIKIVVCEYNAKSGSLVVRGSTKRRSRGLRRGHIVDGEELVAALSEAVADAAKDARAPIKHALISIGGASLVTYIGLGAVAVSRADAEVTNLDIERALAESEKRIAEQPNIKVIHSIPLEYKLDGKKIIGKPFGMRGGKLEIKTLVVTSGTGHFKELLKAIDGASVRIDDCIASPIAESVVALSPLQKNAGVVVVNIGAETVSTAVFEENNIRSLAVFPLGGSDITNDIALGFKIPLPEAEAVKLGQFQGAVKYPQKKVDEIVEARLSDIFELVDGHLSKIGRSGLLPAGIVITGGSALLPGIEKIAKSALRLPASIGHTNIVRNTFEKETTEKASNGSRTRNDILRSPEWTIAYGLCVLGVDTDLEESLGLKLVQNTKGKLLKFFQQFLP